MDTSVDVSPGETPPEAGLQSEMPSFSSLFTLPRSIFLVC